MKRIKKSHIVNTLLIGLVLLLLFSPDANALVRQLLMKTGLFRPSLEAPAGEVSSVDGAAPHASLVFVDGEGNHLDMAALEGKVVFINFWATWCPPCIAEMPSIDKLYQRFKEHEQVAFLIVDVDNKIEESKAFMKDKKLSLPVHVARGKIPSAWLGRSIPTTVILDKKGEMVARHEGMADYGTQQVFDFIDNLIAE